MQDTLASMETILDAWFAAKEDQDFISVVKEEVSPLLDLPPEQLIEEWNSSPEGRVALILLYDQAPRMLYLTTVLGNPRAFAYREWAEHLTTQFWEDGTYEDLTLKQQMFAFFPYHHAENAEYQSRARVVFDRLAERDGEFQWIADSSSNYNDIIQRFGRFPHRNHMLGRDSTDAEWEYLLEDEFSSQELRELKDGGLLPEPYWGAISSDNGPDDHPM